MPILQLIRTLYRASVLVLGLQLAFPVSAAQTEWVYRVKPGDTLIGIADAYLANPRNWPKLQSLNRVADPKRLIPGRALRLPVTLLKRDAAVAEVIHIQGVVSRTPKKGPPQSVAAGARLETGDTIETGSEASASLRFVDGSRLLLTQNTKVTLAEMILFGKTGMARTMLELHRGSLDTRVATQQKPAARYEIRSRALNLAVRGTEFRAHVDDANQTARGEVLGGEVQASGTRGKAINLSPGFGMVATPGEALRTPQRLPRAPDLSSQPGLLQHVPLHFEWPAEAGAAQYRAQVFEGRHFEQLRLDGVFTGGTAKWADLPDGRYMLRVRAIDHNGLEGANAEHEFALKARPEPPFVIAPLEGHRVYGPDVKLRWSASDAAQSYRVQLSSKADFSDLLSDLPALTPNELSIPLPPGQYYWRVATVAAGQDQGPYSDVQGFTQRSIPKSPALEAPQIDDTHLLFRWRAGNVGDTFQVQVARSSDFAQPILDSVVATNQSQIDRPESGTYYLRVRTIDADGFAGPFGPTQQLDVPVGMNWWWLLLLVPLAL